MKKTSGNEHGAVVIALPPSRLEISPSNPRRTMSPAQQAELAASIREHGINVPLLVRPIAEPDAYEIVCGHRRCDAAIMAGLGTVPCIVRELDDATAAEIALIDNLQRVDVPALEEADAFNDLLQRLGSIAAVSAKVGKEQAYVAKRLKLCTLTTWSRQALREKFISIDHALLLARLADAEQDAALKWCLDPHAGSKTSVDKVIEQRLERGKEGAEEDLGEDGAPERTRWKYTWEPQSVIKLKEHIEAESGIPLDRAPWDLDQIGTLVDPDVLSCNACPKNTKANAPLFGDLDIGVAVCTDGACFKSKTEAFVQVSLRRSAVLPGDSRNGIGVTPLRVSWKSTSTPPRLEKVDLCKCGSGKNCSSAAFEGCRGVPKRDQVFKEGQWVEAKKKCEFTGPAVTVDWSDANQRGFMGGDEKLRKPGEVVQVCIDPKCKVHAKDYVRAAKRTAGDGESSSLRRQTGLTAEQKKQNELAAQAENKIRGELVTRAIGQVKKVEGELLRRLALRACGDWLGREDEKRFPGLLKQLKTAKADSVEFARAAAAVLFTSGDGGDELWADVRYDGALEPLEPGRKTMIALLADLGLKDAAKAWVKPAVPKVQPNAAKAAAKSSQKKKAAKNKAARK
jgi:ParB/RepB/Spo0J family partition protein